MAILFGAAYYDEYMPYDRLEQDMKMMIEAGINTIRIAESTWSTEEPRPGEYDFSSVDRVLNAAARWGLNVIIGTPTYAVPHWLIQLDPNVLAETKGGRNRYGARQNMDITNPTYRHYAEGVIRALVSHTAPHPNVIGFQIDNETKHYQTSSENVLLQFRQWMKERYQTIDALNDALGLRYWSNSVTRFEDLPDPRGTINGSYACEFALFQRHLAEEFLLWQSELVQEYKRQDQFITQNFDFEWKFFGAPGHQDGYSGGVQPDICHYKAAKAVSLVGTDIYCFSQDAFTGKEIAFGGDLIRSLHHDNYLVAECQAQAFVDWLPYPGQLRQMAWSHIASGACGMMYWNWHSIHNGLESYWKGILSHDFEPNPVYQEVMKLGEEMKHLSEPLSGLKKQNRIAMVVSTEAMNAVKCFPTHKDLTYNDVVHWMYDALYEMNLECDVIFELEPDWSGYDLMLFPELYCMRDDTADRIRAFVADGGTVAATFRSFFADEHVKIFHDRQPHGLTDVFGMTYNQFTRPVNVTVDGAGAQYWMDMLCPTTAESKTMYQHRYWGNYAAVTRNSYEKGHAWYLGTMMETEKLKEYLAAIAEDAGIAVPEFEYPIICRDCVTKDGQNIHFLMNYSREKAALRSAWSGTDLLTGIGYHTGDDILLNDWGTCILMENAE